MRTLLGDRDDNRIQDAVCLRNKLSFVQQMMGSQEWCPLSGSNRGPADYQSDDCGECDRHFLRTGGRVSSIRHSFGLTQLTDKVLR